jgi:hypothetical protein
MDLTAEQWESEGIRGGSSPRPPPNPPPPHPGCGNRQLLAMEDAEMLCLEMTPPGGGSPVDVTNANRQEYVRWRAHDILLGRRRRQFEALRRGFNSIPLQAHLRLFSGTQLMALLCGEAPPPPPPSAGAGAGVVLGQH